MRTETFLISQKIYHVSDAASTPATLNKDGVATVLALADGRPPEFRGCG